MSDWTDTIDALIDYLRFQQENGTRDAPFSSDLLKKLGVAAPPSAAAVPLPAGLPLAAAERRSATADHQPPPPPLPPLPSQSPAHRRAALDRIAEQAAACSRCPLAQSRTRVVPGQGNPNSPEILFIGEAPGQDEDAQGLAFVGKAGKLLTQMIEAMGFSRDEIFIANICKCRPPDNRPPSPEEMQACIPFLQAQIAVIKPKVIVTLGATAAKGLLNAQTAISKLRGHWTLYSDIPLMPTFHPAYLLRFPPAKHDAWSDLKSVLKRLGRPVPQQKKNPTVT
jgi:DNA polymerase